MQIHELPAQSTTNDSDVLAIDTGLITQKVGVDALGKKIAEDATPAFTSADSTTVTAWTDVTALASGEALKGILNKVSTMFKNIRYLYKMLGTTDISAINDGTVTGALSKLNTDKIKDIVISEKRITLTTTAVIAAHGGKAWTAIGGSAIAPTIPSGYTFVGNVYITTNGLIGVSASFDGSSQQISQSVVPFIFNANTTQLNSGSSITILLYSLCVKKS